MRGWKKKKTLLTRDRVGMLRLKVWGIRRVYCALHDRNVARLLLTRNAVANDDTMLLKLLRQVQKYQGVSVIVEEKCACYGKRFPSIRC